MDFPKNTRNMKKYLLALALSTATTALADSLVNHITVQWSTNSVDWNNNLSTDDDYSLSFDSGMFLVLFVNNKLTADNGVVGGFRRLEVTTLYGSNLSSITNALNIQTVNVQPVGSNVLYRVASYMSNETFHVAYTNDYGSNTNTPPNP